MNKIDWKRKLTSRKFWMAVIGFITPIMTAFNFSDEVITQVTAIVMGGGALIAYILAEGWADAKREENIFVPLIKEDE